MRTLAWVIGALAALLPGFAGPAHASDLDAPIPPAGPVEVSAAADDMTASSGSASSGSARPPAAGARGNPLWSVPLESLAATRARPIFSPSRRPPLPAEAPPPPAPAAPTQAAPARPRVSLIGTVVGRSDAYGVFLDPTSNAVLRLRTGETHEGWVLRSVSVRNALMQNGRSTVVLALPAPAGGAGAVAAERLPEGPAVLARPARPSGGRPTAERITAPRRPPPSPADLDSSH